MNHNDRLKGSDWLSLSSCYKNSQTALCEGVGSLRLTVLQEKFISKGLNVDLLLLLLLLHRSPERITFILHLELGLTQAPLEEQNIWTFYQISVG
ncbi:unnamed protein product [Arctogadus glacialis]